MSISECYKLNPIQKRKLRKAEAAGQHAANPIAIPAGIEKTLPLDNMDTVVSYMPTVNRQADYSTNEDISTGYIEQEVEPEHKNPPARKFTVSKINEIEPVEIHDTQMDEVTVTNTPL